MKMDFDARAQGSTNVYLNGELIAAAQTNGTDGKIIRKLLTRVELLGGNYEFSTLPLKKVSTLLILN